MDVHSNVIKGNSFDEIEISELSVKYILRKKKKNKERIVTENMGEIDRKAFVKIFYGTKEDFYYDRKINVSLFPHFY